MAQQSSGPGLIGATQKSFQVLEVLNEIEGGRVAEVAEHMGTPTSTAHSHLSTLYKLEYVVKEGDEYHIGFRFLEFGEHAKSRRPIFELVEDIVDELAEETEERAQFCVEEHGLGVFVNSAEGSHGINTNTGIGARVPLHQTAVGKAILAHLPEVRVESIIERRGLPESTERTITQRSELMEELRVTRDRGYGLNNEEYITGVRAIGVPVRDQNDRLVGSLGLAGPAHRMTDDVFENEYPTIMLGIVNEAEINLKYS